MLHLNTLLNILVAQYFNDSRCITLLKTTQFDFGTSLLPVLNVFVEDGRLNFDVLFKNHGCEDIFILDDDGSTVLNEFESAILYNITAERYINRRYVIITPENRIESIVKLKYVEHLKDLIIVSLVDSDSEEIYTISTNKFVSTQFDTVLYMDTWFSVNQSFKENSYLLPDKAKNAMGKVFTMVTLPFEPNSMLYMGRYDGTELGPMMDYCKKYNYTQNFSLAGENQFGNILKNGSADGLSKLIVDNVGVVAFGAIGYWIDYYAYSEFSKPHVRSGITCIVPLPGVLLGWQVPFISFPVEMWLFVIVTIIVCSIMYYSLTVFFKQTGKTKREKHNIQKGLICYTSCLNIVALYLMQPIKIPKNYLLKGMLGMVLLTVLAITNAYSSGLYGILAVPRLKKTINSVKDMADFDFKWGGGTDAWVTPLIYYEDPNYQKIIKNFIVGNDQVMRNLSLTNQVGFAMERLHHGHYGFQTYIKRDIIKNFRIMKDDIYWCYWTYMHRKNSILMDHIDSYILRYFQTGLSAYKESQIVLDFMDTTLQRTLYFNTHEKGGKVEKLRWAHVEGAFSILILGYTIAFVVLLIELAWAWSQKTKH